MRSAANGSGPVAELAGARVSLGGRTVLDRVDLVLERASVFVLLGPNGAGKTTLMRALAGRLPVSDGRVAVFGRDPRSDAAARRAIGLVPQTIALYPKLTVRENLAAFAAFARPPAGVALPDLTEVMRLVRVEEVADRAVGTLSGGFQRRANIGAALVAGPDLLLMDEPTVGLDGPVAAVLAEIIVGLARSGTSVLVVTHDLPVAAAIADRIGWLAEGRLVAQGCPAALLADSFAGRLKVDLAIEGDEPGGPLARTLTGFGLRRHGLSDRWSAAEGGLARDDVPAVLDAIARHGRAVHEVNIAEQGFADLCRHLAQRGARA